MALRLLTLNTKGLLNAQTRYELLSLCVKEQISILLLQETHFYNINNVLYFKSMFNTNQAYFSFGTNQSRGVGIVFLNPNIVIEKSYVDLDGRLVYTDIIYNAVQFRIINIYAPNIPPERVAFLKDLYPHCLTSKHLIIGGDFNCIVNPNIDKIGGKVTYGTTGNEQIQEIVKDFQLLDCFRILNPDEVNVTFTSSKVGCRLDRFYITKYLCNDVVVCKNVPFGNSDHDAVYLHLNVSGDITFGSGYWKFNNSLLQDKTFVKEFSKYFSDLIDGMEIYLEIWDHLKEQIKNFTIYYCKKKAKVKRDLLKVLEKSYYRLQYFERKNPGQFIDRIREIKKQIKELQNQNYIGSKIRSRAENLINQEKPSKFFYQQEIKRAKQKTITKITTESSTCVKSGDILDAFKDFYSKLYTDEAVDQDIVDLFLKSLPKLRNDLSAQCEGPITKEELLLALRDMENNKSPGSDGLTKEFYSTFSSILLDPLVHVANLAFKEGHLSDTQKMGYITLLCKDPDNSTDVKNYRPISLLNCDYKLISKTITNRVKKVLEFIINPDQTCAVPGRTIFNNLHLMRNIIDYCEQKQLPLAFISLDQEKAFDRVNYDFLFQTLSAFNFGPSLIHWIKTLYTEVRSSIIVNNHISDSFLLHRGVRQGCSLSPLLYVLILEPFARKIREDTQILGIKLPGTSEMAKLSLYADDSLAICTCDVSIRRVLYWCRLYGGASGAKLNLKKTKGVWLGKWKSRSDHPFGISWVENCTLLGIKFGNNVTPDDIWQPILSKFLKILIIWKQRHLSFVEKSIVVKMLACGNIVYTGSVYVLPQHYLKQFERAIFKFLWPTNVEPLKRTVCYNYKENGGLDIVNINVKLQSLRLKHLQNIIMNNESKYVYFSVYWIGLSLRQYQPLFASNNRPHSEYVPEFYRTCMKDLKTLLEIKSDNYSGIFGNFSTKQLYRIMLELVVTVPRVERIFPSIDFKLVFERLHNDFIDRFIRDVMFRIIHEIIPVSYFMNNIGYYKSNKCILCDNRVETIPHLFYECEFVEPLITLVKNWLNVLSNNQFKHFNISHIRFHIFPYHISSKKIESMCLFLISLMCYVIWNTRCIIKFQRKKITSNGMIMMFINHLVQRIQADFQRFHNDVFESYWCNQQLFCQIINGKLELNIGI